MNDESGFHFYPSPVENAAAAILAQTCPHGPTGNRIKMWTELGEIACCKEHLGFPSRLLEMVYAGEMIDKFLPSLELQ